MALGVSATIYQNEYQTAGRGVMGPLTRQAYQVTVYDTARLAAHEVPVAAAVNHDDMNVDTPHSLATSRTVRGLRTWVTDEFEHDGVRTGGPRVLDRLLALARGDA